MKPQRVPLFDFPDVVLHADELAVKNHSRFAAAKGGDAEAAGILVAQFISQDSVDRLRSDLAGRAVQLAPLHALESEGVNEIPAALANALSGQLGMPVDRSIVQTNSVGHTGADGFHRLANQALFDGPVTTAQPYLLVDDFVGQGGTLANLIGYIHFRGGTVIGATVLTGKGFSAKLAADRDAIQTLRHKHGRELEIWWIEKFGFDFDRLTRSEARYLEKTSDAHTIRDRVTEAGSDISP